MWIKKGVIIEPQDNLWWMKTHAMLPTVEKVDQDLYKIFFSGRGIDNVSHIGYCLLKVKDNRLTVVKFSEEPVLSPGERGCFDDNGVTPSCLIDDKMYYIGWNSGTSTYRMSLVMGLANRSGENFVRNSRAPLFTKTDREPFGILTAPWVIKDGGEYKMWYVSGEGWISKDLPRYNIKFASSDDGVNWQRDGLVAIDLKHNETALARPCVIKSDEKYEMYFSFKDPRIGYRIGYAESKDGINWERHPNACLDVSKQGWDSEMVQYSCVFKHNDTKIMLYNGNQYGKTGIGYAIEQ
tara:strand:- start:2040 stop:2924 length:885 start_codon:yes stop_codon:yes gene_type:complete